MDDPADNPSTFDDLLDDLRANLREDRICVLNGSVVDNMTVIDLRILLTSYSNIVESMLADQRKQTWNILASLEGKIEPISHEEYREASFSIYVICQLLAHRGTVFARRGYRHDRLFPRLVKKPDIEHWRQYLRLALKEMAIIDMIDKDGPEALLADPSSVARGLRYEFLLGRTRRLMIPYKDAPDTIDWQGSSVDRSVFIPFYRTANDIVSAVRNRDASMSSMHTDSVM